MRELDLKEVSKVLDILVSSTGNHRNNYSGLVWFEKDLALDEISIDLRYIQQRPEDPVYRMQRKGNDEKSMESFRQDIATNGLREPLIVVYDNHVLADGYHRYQALRLFNQKRAKVYHGFYPDKRVVWDLVERCFKAA